MNKELLAAFGITILLTVTVATSVDLGNIQTADAAKAKGTTTQKYGAATKSQVCGDRLCSEVPPEERRSVMTKSKIDSTITSADLDILFEKMDSVHKTHQSQMRDMWESMSAHQQSQMIQKMNSMIEKMEGMDANMHMNKMMKMMTGDEKGMHDKSADHSMMKKNPVYNETLNPKQIDYPNILGFNDLHIHAIRHLDVEKSHGPADHLLQTIVHHHCKVYDDMTASCLLFPYGMTDQDKPYGIEYVITADQYQELPDEEKEYWHYHKTEFPRAQATFPELSDEELAEILPILDETYGKVYYFWNYGDTYPMGEPYVLIVQDIPDQ